VAIEGGATGHEITASDAGAALACVREAGLEISAAVEKAGASLSPVQCVLERLGWREGDLPRGRDIKHRASRRIAALARR
jgi:hypothetical protein